MKWDSSFQILVLLFVFGLFGIIMFLGNI